MERNKSQKHKKLCDQNIDRISSLPEEILYEIFSFLPTKDVVKTMILSKELYKLRISLPYLHFEESDLLNKERFTDFVNNFLQYHDKSNIIRFRLKCENRVWENIHITAWINAAVSAGVQELDIYTRGSIWFYRLKVSSLFNCDSLVSLTLDLCNGIFWPVHFRFPNMKSLHLFHVYLREAFSDQLLKSTSLEEVTLAHCRMSDYFPKNYFPRNFFPVPDLVEDGNRPRTFSKLKKALLHSIWVLSSGNRNIDMMISSFSNLICTFSNVEILRLHKTSMQLLYYKKNLLAYLPTFCNLKHLETTLGSEEVHVGILACLLDSSPVLQSLHIEFNESHWSEFDNLGQFIFNRTRPPLQPGEYPSLCVPPCLKQIKMVFLQGSKNEVELASFFLANAQVLENMIVQFHKTVNKDLNLLHQELLGLPRISTNVVFDF